MPSSRIRLPLERGELRRLVSERRREVQTLLAGRNYSGAYYLAGYIVELALKVCIAKNMRRNVIPLREHINSIYTHDLEKLVVVAELIDALKRAGSTNGDLASNWATVAKWDEQSRYRRSSRSNAMALYRAITDEPNGVLPWIAQHW